MTTTQAVALQRAELMAPLIRSIAGEVRERVRAMRHLEASLADLSACRGEAVSEIRLAESELFQHRREIERVERELARLGCHLDPKNPEQVVCSADGREWTYMEHVNKTASKPKRRGLRA